MSRSEQIVRLVESGAWRDHAANDGKASTAEVIASIVEPQGPLPDGHPDRCTLFDPWWTARDEASAADCRLAYAERSGASA